MILGLGGLSLKAFGGSQGEGYEPEAVSDLGFRDLG